MNHNLKVDIFTILVRELYLIKRYKLSIIMTKGMSQIVCNRFLAKF